MHLKSVALLCIGFGVKRLEKQFFLVNSWLSFTTSLTSPFSPAAIIGDFAFPDSISASAQLQIRTAAFYRFIFLPKRFYLFVYFCLVMFISLRFTPPKEWIPRVLHPEDQHEAVKGCSKASWNLMAKNIQVMSSVKHCNPIQDERAFWCSWSISKFCVAQILQLGKPICWGWGPHWVYILHAKNAEEAFV